MRVAFIAPDLFAAGGHALTWTDALARSLIERHGAQVRIYGHRDAPAAVRGSIDARCALEPRFTVTPYVGTRRARVPLLARLHDRRHARDLLRQLGAGVREADLWIVTTLFPSTVAALAAVPERPPVAGIVHLAPEEYPGLGWPASLPSAVTLHATTPRVSEAFHARGLPASFMPHILGAPPAPRLRSAPVTVGLLGEQRREKGDGVVAPLADALLAAGFRVLLQDSLGGTADASKDPPGLERVGFVADFGSLVDRCDLVVTPYDPARYRWRMSGIAMDALARAVPCIVPEDSHAADVVRRFDAGMTLADSSVATIVAAVEAARERYRNCAAGALEAAGWLAREHGADRAADALLLPFRESRRPRR